MATAVWDDLLTDAGPDVQVLRPADAGSGDALGRELARTLAAAAVAGDAGRIDHLLADACANGAAVEAVLIGPVTAAARRLGEFWIEDSCDFVAVTMATWQLRRGVERLLDAYPAPLVHNGRHAVFAAAPGDQHGFGSFLVTEIFARSGWIATPADSGELAGLVADAWIDLIGLTATADRHRDALRPAIAQLRRASRNPRLRIIVGGRVFVDDPALAGVVGADGTAADALAALALADALVPPLGLPC